MSSIVNVQAIQNQHTTTNSSCGSRGTHGVAGKGISRIAVNDTKRTVTIFLTDNTSVTFNTGKDGKCDCTGNDEQKGWQYASPLAAPVAGHATAIYKQFVYAVGGWQSPPAGRTNYVFTKRIQMLDTSLPRGTAWKDVSPLDDNWTPVSFEESGMIAMTVSSPYPILYVFGANQKQDGAQEPIFQHFGINTQNGDLTPIPIGMLRDYEKIMQAQILSATNGTLSTRAMDLPEQDIEEPSAQAAAYKEYVFRHSIAQAAKLLKVKDIRAGTTTTQQPSYADQFQGPVSDQSAGVSQFENYIINESAANAFRAWIDNTFPGHNASIRDAWTLYGERYIAEEVIQYRRLAEKTYGRFVSVLSTFDNYTSPQESVSYIFDGWANNVSGFLLGIGGAADNLKEAEVAPRTGITKAQTIGEEIYQFGFGYEDSVSLEYLGQEMPYHQFMFFLAEKSSRMLWAARLDEYSTPILISEVGGGEKDFLSYSPGLDDPIDTATSFLPFVVYAEQSKVTNLMKNAWIREIDAPTNYYTVNTDLPAREGSTTITIPNVISNSSSDLIWNSFLVGGREVKDGKFVAAKTRVLMPFRDGKRIPTTKFIVDDNETQGIDHIQWQPVDTGLDFRTGRAYTGASANPIVTNMHPTYGGNGSAFFVAGGQAAEINRRGFPEILDSAEYITLPDLNRCIVDVTQDEALVLHNHIIEDLRATIDRMLQTGNIKND